MVLACLQEYVGVNVSTTPAAVYYLFHILYLSIYYLGTVCESHVERSAVLTIAMTLQWKLSHGLNGSYP